MNWLNKRLVEWRSFEWWYQVFIAFIFLQRGQNCFGPIGDQS